MNAPLSRYLTRFATQPPLGKLAAEPMLVEAVVAQPMTTLAVAELDARLEAARGEARAAAAAEHAHALSLLAGRHETALAEAVAAVREERIAEQAETLLAQVDKAYAQLRGVLADGIAKVLRPVVADAVRECMLASLDTAVACLLADPARPAVTLRAPADLIAAIRARGAPIGLELVVADLAEAVVVADGTRIETRLKQALADLATMEA